MVFPNPKPRIQNPGLEVASFRYTFVDSKAHSGIVRQEVFWATVYPGNPQSDKVKEPKVSVIVFPNPEPRIPNPVLHVASFLTLSHRLLLFSTKSVASFSKNPQLSVVGSQFFRPNAAGLRAPAFFNR